MMTLAGALACRWARRRLQRYLDADPAAPLSAAEVRRIEGHIATCERCSSLAVEHRGMRRALAFLGASRGPDPAAVARLRTSVERMIGEDGLL
jgi:anti-sigma factor RsiW